MSTFGKAANKLAVKLVEVTKLPDNVCNLFSSFAVATTLKFSSKDVVPKNKSLIAADEKTFAVAPVEAEITRDVAVDVMEMFGPAVISKEVRTF